MQDVLGDGEKMRVFTLVDVHTRECLALKVGRQFRGVDVAAMLSVVIATRGKRWSDWLRQSGRLLRCAIAG